MSNNSMFRIYPIFQTFELCQFRPVVESVSSRWHKALVTHVEKTEMASDGPVMAKKMEPVWSWWGGCSKEVTGRHWFWQEWELNQDTASKRERANGQTGSGMSLGPMTASEWRRITNILVKNKNILLHSDASRINQGHSFDDSKQPVGTLHVVNVNGEMLYIATDPGYLYR